MAKKYIVDRRYDTYSVGLPDHDGVQREALFTFCDRFLAYRVRDALENAYKAGLRDAASKRDR